MEEWDVDAEAGRPQGGWLVEHFRWYRTLPPWEFCWRITLEGLAVGMLAAIVTSIIGAPDRKFDFSFETLVFFAVFIAPVFETLVCQSLPVFIARFFKASFPVQVILATCVFALLHLAEGVGTFIAAGLTGGFYFSFTYVHWREKSRWQAFWVTAASHALHNAALMPLVALSV